MQLFTTLGRRVRASSGVTLHEWHGVAEVGRAGSKRPQASTRHISQPASGAQRHGQPAAARPASGGQIFAAGLRTERQQAAPYIYIFLAAEGPLQLTVYMQLSGAEGWASQQALRAKKNMTWHND